LKVEAKLAENRGKTWGKPAEMSERSADKPLQMGAYPRTDLLQSSCWKQAKAEKIDGFAYQP